MNETDASIKVESMKLPEFLNTSKRMVCSGGIY